MPHKDAFTQTLSTDTNPLINTLDNNLDDNILKFFNIETKSAASARADDNLVLVKNAFTQTPSDVIRPVINILDNYYNGIKVQFFNFGTKHTFRARAVANAIFISQDLKEISEILSRQIEIMEGKATVATGALILRMNVLGMKQRFVMDDGLKNKSKDLSRSGYYKALVDSLNLVTKAQELQPEILEMKIQGRLR